MTLVIAHRGSSADEVENSLAAFRRAARDGADAVELDVHATADGELVVRHDSLLTGQPLATMQLRDVRMHTLQNGEPIPTLTEALAAVGSTMTVFIELKTLTIQSDRHLLEVIESSPAPDRCHLHAFDHRIVRRLRGARPRSHLGILSSSYPVRPLTQLEDAGAGGLWQEEWLIDRELVDSVHQAEAKLYAWTVNSPARMKALQSMGVDGICTNHPALARSVLA